MARRLYLTHPQVRIDPAQEVTRWSLSDLGRARVLALASSGALAGIGRVISSAEVKAVETAEPLAAALGCRVEVRAGMHENDRSATGYLPEAEFEAVADAFFAHPAQSIRGWETAIAAQRRIVTEVEECLRDCDSGVLFVGHGAVGSLLWCHLAGVGISRAHDQIAGGGCVFDFDAVRANGAKWAALETMIDGTKGGKHV